MNRSLLSRSPLGARAFFRDPTAYARAQRAQPALVRFSGGRTRYVLVSDPAGVWRVLVSAGEAFAPGKWKRRARRFLGPTLNTLHGQEHRERRLLLQPSLRRPRVDGFTARIAERAERAAASLAPGETLVLRDALDPLSLAMASDVLLSRELGEEAEPLARALAEVMRSVPRLTPPLRATRQARALARVHAFLDEVVAERRAAGPGEGDLVDALVASGLPAATVRGELTAFLLAAVDEPPSALESAAWLLARHPESERRLRAELAAGDTKRPFLDAVLRETLRLFPPARHVDRCPVRDVEVAGERVPAGTNILVSPVVTHRGPAHARPDAFAPERWLDGPRPPRGAYVPFGAGVHTCIGEPLARTIMAETLAALASRWHLAVADAAPPPLPAGPRLVVTPAPSGGGGAG